MMNRPYGAKALEFGKWTEKFAAARAQHRCLRWSEHV